MSCFITAAKRRRTCLLASSLLFPVLCLNASAARAQQTASAAQLPPIEVNPPGDANRTRAKPATDEGSGSRRVAPATTSNTSAAPPNNAPSDTATTNRQFAG